MNCDAFQRRLQHLLDQRVSPRQDAELHAHSLICGECQAHLEMQERLLEALGSFQPPRPHDDFADRIVEAVCHGRSTNSFPRTMYEEPLTTASQLDQRQGTRTIPSEVSPQSPTPRSRFSRTRAPEQLEFPSPAPPASGLSMRWKAARWGIGIATCLSLLILGTFHQHVNWEPTAKSRPHAKATLPPEEAGTSGTSSRAEGSNSGMDRAAILPDVRTRLLTEMVTKEEEQPPMVWATGPLAASSLGVPLASPRGMEEANWSGYPLWLTALTSQLPDVPPESLQSVDQIAGGLRPIAETLGAALETIRRSLPIVDRDDRPAGKPQAGLSSRVLIG